MPEAIPRSISNDVSSSSSNSSATLPPLTPIRTALLSTRFSSWYPALRKISPKATIIDVKALQPDFFDWLEEDGLILPRGSGSGVIGGEDDELDADTSDDDDDDDEEAPPPPRDFSTLDEKIRTVIEKYDGEVFPKLDWSAPRDAAWILPEQTLKCTTPADVYLLLKSSDFVAKDISQLEELKGESISAPDPVSVEERLDSLQLNTSTSDHSTSSPPPCSLNLIIKRHFNLNPSHEFRCFVRSNQFVAITQRDGTYYPFLQDARTQKEIRHKLFHFWTQHLQHSFSIKDYVFDVYFTRDRSKVFLVDVNPYIPRTDALLWDWEELEKRAQRSWIRSSSPLSPSLSSTRVGVNETPTTVGQDENDNLDISPGSNSDSEADSYDSLTGSSSSSEESDEDPRGEPFVRIYTDGRPPTTHYSPRPPPRQHRILPALRLLTSEAESSAAGGRGPTYASNMVPKDMIDVSSGRGVEEFAKIWSEQQQQSA
ncbi:unnamed protein product [Sympodiomycopsis kandeliae]